MPDPFHPAEEKAAGPLELRVQEEKPPRSFTFAASVAVPDVKRIALPFPPVFFVSFVSFCSKMRPTTCTRYSPKLTDSPVRSLPPRLKCTGSWGQDCWRASTSGAYCASSSSRGIPVLNQEEVVIDYKGTVFKEKLKFDLLADGCLLVELKAVQDVLPIHKAQLLSYMKLLNVPLGLLFNFHEVTLVDGISRLVLPGANQP